MKMKTSKPFGQPWLVTLGCTAVSDGCLNCSAMIETPAAYQELHSQIVKFNGNNHEWTGQIASLPGEIVRPLHWHESRDVHVNPLSDLFHPSVSENTINTAFSIMAICKQHHFHLSTKYVKRLREYLAIDALDDDVKPARYKAIVDKVIDWSNDTLNLGRDPERSASKAISNHFGISWPDWPLSNLRLVASIEHQTAAEERLPDFFATPAAAHIIWCQPLLGPINLEPWLAQHKVAQVVIGGETGHNARACSLEWIRGLIYQCASAGVPLWIAQLGAKVQEGHGQHRRVALRDLNGQDTTEWPVAIKVRQSID